MACGCKNIAKGIVGLAKAAIGIDRAEDSTIAKRREICRQCPQAELRKRRDGRDVLTVVSKCNACGCVS